MVGARGIPGIPGERGEQVSLHTHFQHPHFLPIPDVFMCLLCFSQGETGLDGPKGDRGEPGMTVRTNRYL